MDRGTRLMLIMLTIAVCMLTAKFVFESEPEAQASYAMAGGTEPTIVWYGLSSAGDSQSVQIICRAWSDGLVEMKRYSMFLPETCGGVSCSGEWHVISHPNEGLAAMSDVNGDEAVDVNDLLAVIGDWGPSPHNFIPPSDCPLAMINP